MSSGLSSLFRSPPRIVALLTTAAAIVVYNLPPPEGVAPDAMRGAGLALFAVGLYATVAVPEYLTAILFFVIAMMLGIAPANVTFSGFESTAFWLMFGGLLVGVAVQNTGLGTRIAVAITSRLAGSYVRLVIGVSIVGLAMCFVMPSTMGRLVLLVPVVIALCDHVGYTRGRPERAGLLLALACSTWMPAGSIMPSNVPNVILIGVAEKIFGMHLTYGDYMLIHFPVNGIVRLLSVIALVLVLFPPKKGGETASDEPHTHAPMGPAAKRLAVILAVTLGLWITDFIHHISPAWIALLAGVLCLWPGLGLISADDLKTKVNFPSTFYIAGVLSLGAVLVETGAGAWLGGWLLGHMPLSQDSPLLSFYAMTGLGMLVNMAATAPSVPVIVGPLAGEISQLTGFPIKTVLMTLVMSYSTVILPYQVPPLIFALQIGGVAMRDGAKMTLGLAAISVLVCIPLNYLWWMILGML